LGQENLSENGKMKGSLLGGDWKKDHAAAGKVNTQLGPMEKERIRKMETEEGENPKGTRRRKKVK